jgi:hypothetical protein
LLAWYWAFVAPLLYCAAVQGVQVHVREQGRPYGLRTCVIVHNAALAAVSAWLLGEMLLQLWRMFTEEGPWDAFCDPTGRWTLSGRMVWLLYLNYLLKYVELGDTIWLALRGKPTPFLHVYHHSATLVLCLTQLRGATSPQWFVVSINLAVHVLMYSYYALQTAGIDVWWKRLVTVAQIAQFVVVIAGCSLALTVGLLGGPGACHGDMFAGFFGVAVLLSYLVLFVRFYRQTYARKHI